ncbi:MAG: hypothetical protein K2O99_00750 [Lachnospiraceae bacterium]|nr:hypothetical protein [Lachnospiraceae bacterium]
MKQKWKLGMLLTVLTVFVMQLTVMAAGETVTMNYCYIEGNQVNVIASGAVAPSDDGNYYLFALKTYEREIGARVDYCAAAPAAELVQFAVPLELDTANSKLYSRFVITAKRGGMFVPVSTEMYITNPEAVAKGSTKSIAEATGTKKGLFCDWQYANSLSELGAGYVATSIKTSQFFDGGGGFNYTYNGKTYQFNAFWVQATDQLVKIYNAQNVDIVLGILNDYSAGTADMIYPEALGTGVNPHYYAVNVDAQPGAEKLEALMSFLAERYNGGSHGSVHNYVIGNEVNSSRQWHYAGEISAEELALRYARQFRVCYNAIKSHNLGANVYACIDQRWNFDDGNLFPGKKVIDTFNAEIARTGNIDWGLSFHPYPVPLTHAKFWTVAPGYGFVKVNHTENADMIIPTNIDVIVNYMTKPEFLAPSGAIRNLFISEVGFSSMSASGDTNEEVQAAALVYAYKLIAAQPAIKGVTFNSVIDNPIEVAQDKLANGLMRSDGAQKPAYNAFKIMDKGGNVDHFLPYIGASSGAQLGVQ